MGSTPSILVVDADEGARALYTESCARVGWNVVEASDGREALTEALVRPPTLVMTEIKLPLMDGFALCEILRRDRATAAVPILVVTADADPDDVERARRAGADTVLVKSTPIERILGEMQRLVADSRLARARLAAQRADAVNESANRVASKPPMICPLCDCSLTYTRSHIGGVSERDPEQWDYYECPASCGTFQYRHRTQKLRRVTQ